MAAGVALETQRALTYPNDKGQVSFVNAGYVRAWLHSINRSKAPLSCLMPWVCIAVLAAAGVFAAVAASGWLPESVPAPSLGRRVLGPTASAAEPVMGRSALLVYVILRQVVLPTATASLALGLLGVSERSGTTPLFAELPPGLLGTVVRWASVLLVAWFGFGGIGQLVDLAGPNHEGVPLWATAVWHVWRVAGHVLPLSGIAVAGWRCWYLWTRARLVDRNNEQSPGV
jgi:hypothetical protein